MSAHCKYTEEDMATMIRRIMKAAGISELTLENEDRADDYQLIATEDFLGDFKRYRLFKNTRRVVIELTEAQYLNSVFDGAGAHLYIAESNNGPGSIYGGLHLPVVEVLS